jgi:hypothetical protein
MKRSLLVFLLMGIVGCASSTLQTDALLAQRQNFPSTQVIPEVPFVEQTAGHCGPATLTMAMKWAGKNISVDELASQVYTPGMKGSLQLDMISASRRNGMIAIPLQGLEPLLVEVTAGHPVIVFENLAFSWAPRWHYALVFGYDLPGQKIIMHSGSEAFKRWDLRKFERSWKLGDYWGLVVLPPGQLAANANELAHVKAIAALEQIGKMNEAEVSYLEVLKRWPQSLPAHIGLANIAFGKKDSATAEKFLIRATVDHPGSAVAWHNLSIAQRAGNKKIEARQSADQALQLASPEQRLAFEKSLKDQSN